jgi:hypothetical protein
VGCLRRRSSSGADRSEGCPCLLSLSEQRLSSGDFERRVVILPSLQHAAKTLPLPIFGCSAAPARLLPPPAIAVAAASTEEKIQNSDLWRATYVA